MAEKGGRIEQFQKRYGTKAGAPANAEAPPAEDAPAEAPAEEAATAES